MAGQLKLGDALVKEGRITKDQLKLALDRQVVFGGRIGTNIVELGLMKEGDMLQFLSSYFRVPPVDPADLDNIEPEIISSISPAIADKYRVIPFRKDRNRMHAAMLNPRNFAGIDELRFITAYDIIPHAITELRLLYCLEKYYDIKRDLRYVSIFEEEAGSRIADHETYILNIREQFATVKEREDVAKIMLGETKPYVKRIAFFIHKGDQVVGWKARGIKVDGFRISADVPSIFSETLRRKAAYRGPLMRIQGNEPFIALLNSAPEDCTMIPVMMKDKVVALVYADNGEGAVLDSGVSFINRLASMAGQSFEMTLIRKRIFSL